MEEKKKCRGCFGWFVVLLILAVVAAAVVITIKKKSGGGGGGAEPVPGPPGAITQKYSNALKLAVQFFDVQKCTLSLSFPLYWRFHQCGQVPT